MTKDTYLYLCHEADAGRDMFVTHPSNHEEGRIERCVLPSDHIVVSTPNGGERCWDYHDCDEMSRPKEQFPRC